MADFRKSELNLRFDAGDHIEKALVKAAIGGDRLLDRDIGNVGSVQYCDASPLVLVNHVNCMQAVTLAEQTIVCGGYASALRMAEVNRTRFETGLLLDKVSERFTDAGKTSMAEGVNLRRSGHLADFRKFASFSDDDDAVMLAVVVVV